MLSLHPHEPTATGAHCSYLDIYISQKIRLYKEDLEGQFQTYVSPLTAEDIWF